MTKTVASLGLYFLNIVILLVEIFFLVANWNMVPAYPLIWTNICFPFTIVSIIFNLLYIWIKRIKIYDLRIVMILLMYIFMYGRIWLIQLGMQDLLTWSLHKLIPLESLFNTSLFVICCNQLLFLGLFFGKEIGIKQSIPETTSPYILNAIEKTGIVLLVIAIPCRLITDISLYFTTNVTGSYLNYQNATGLFDDFAFLLVPGLICVCESHKRQRFIFLATAFTYFIVVMALTGDRRYYAASILALSMYFVFSLLRKEYRKRHFISIAIMIILGLVFLNFLAVVQKMRVNGLVSLSEFISIYSGDIFALDDVFFDVLSEFGISFFSLASVIEHVPNYLNYQCGSTIIKAIPSVLPFGFFNSILGVVSPSDYINNYTGLPVGGTLYGDLYANFGFFSFPFVFLTGFVIKILGSRLNPHKSTINVVFYFTISFVLVNLVRCTIFEIIRPIVWCTLIPYFIFRLFYRGTVLDGRAAIRG